MPRLRLFAQAREAAGGSSFEFAASSLGELLDRAVDAFGEPFARVLERSTVWVNGDEPVEGRATPLGSDDEVAAIPPVSGG